MLLEKMTRDEFVNLWKQPIPSLLKAVHSKAKLGDVLMAIEKDPVYREIYEKWDRFTLEERSDAWEKMNSLMSKAAYATRPYCVRCGDCCKESSPTLYEEDLVLLMEGVLDKRDVLTLRKGEIGYSPKEGRNVVLAEEMIKVRDTAGGGQCIFYRDKGCGIYENRPLQCTALECWRPEGFEILSSRRPLARRAVLMEDHPLWEVVVAHEKRSSHEMLRSILNKGQDLDRASEEKALEIMLYDLHVRMFMEENVYMKREEMDFFFGRPIAQALSVYGYRLEGEPGQPTRIVREQRKD